MINEHKCTECRYLTTHQTLAKNNKVKDMWSCNKWGSDLNKLNACNKFKLYKSFHAPLDISTGALGIGALIWGVAVGVSIDSAGLVFGSIGICIPMFILGCLRSQTSSDHIKAKKRLERNAK